MMLAKRTFSSIFVPFFVWFSSRCLSVTQRAQLSVTNWPWRRIWILWWMKMMEFWTTTMEMTLTSARIMKRKMRKALLSESFILIDLRFRTESPLISWKLYWTNLFQLSLIQDGISMCSEKSIICTPPHLSQVSLTLPLKQFHCLSD